MAFASPVRGQHAESSVTWLDASTAEVRFAVTWNRTLGQTVDSLRMAVVNPADLERVGGGLETLDHLLQLANKSLPAVRITASSFDEVTLPAGSGYGLAAREAPEARAVGLGIFRKQPVVSIVAPAVHYDPNSGILRRYNEVVVQVSGVAPPTARVSGTEANNPHLLVTRSALADGQIFRIPVTEEGLYRIDRSLLSAIGLNPDQVDPNQIQVLGNGGRPVPALNSDPRIADLAENPVLVTGGGDGRFDAGDELIFYAAGLTSWTWGTSGWEHRVHPYANANAYFLRVGSGPGSRIQTTPFGDATGVPLQTSVQGRWVVDFEEQVWSREHGSGTDWMSNTIRGGGSRALLSSQSLPNLQAGEVQFRVRAAVASNPRATLSFESDGQILAQPAAPGIVVNRAESPSAVPLVTTFSRSFAAGASVSLTMRLLNQINEPQAAADYVQVFYPQSLSGSSGYVRLAGPASGSSVLEFSAFASAPRVWDVTEPASITALEVQPAGGAFRVHLRASARPRELVAFIPSAVRPLVADALVPVANQNLHGVGTFPDLAIVTPPEFLEAADELADMRRADGLNVLVARTDQIYNEFSGGVPDMRAVRDFFRFLYDRAPSDAQRLRFALLFGDGHYDFRNLTQREGSLSNWVFPYETDESLITDATFTSDDYFGLLDEDEGEWRYTTYFSPSFERMDIGIGRIPAQSLSEARMVVDKIRRYESPESFGTWRTRYTFVADDGPTGLSGQQDDADLHVQNVDQVAELIRGGLYPRINVRKIYAESFDRVFLNGFRIPDAKKEINDALNAGTLVFNYSGHGGPDGLAQEEIFTKEDAWALTNQDRLAVFVTATCSFGWWDLQEDQSGAEALLLNDNGGAVALLTTVRLVYTSGDTTSLNAGLNRALNIELFRSDPDGGARRLGDALLSTKNTSVGLQGNSRKFNLLGDPSMRLGVPPREVAVESLNGIDLEAEQGQMQALDRVTIRGTVRNLAGQTDASFDGTVDVTVYDAVRNVPLLKQRRMPNPFYRIREDLIWRGQARASAGEWSATFVVPKDISYSNQPGRISAYAVSAAEQGLGFSESFAVGGTSSNPPNDTQGPQIRLALNDTSFVSGSTTPAQSELIVRLFDESGMNTVGAGVGHEMLLIVNGDESNAEDISTAFTSEPDSYQRGEVRWPMTFEESGPGTLSVRAWDVLNNSATVDLDFVVIADEVLRLRNVYNYPNPMSRQTRFVFEHNQPAGTPARVRVRIFTLNGSPIKTIGSEEALPGGILNSGTEQILWDGLDDDLDRLATGIYLYQLRVEVDRPDGTTQASEIIEKLAVIR